MGSLKERAKVFFKESNGFRTMKELLTVFDNAEVGWLLKEGLIEVTTKPDLWAWKSD